MRRLLPAGTGREPTVFCAYLTRRASLPASLRVFVGLARNNAIKPVLIVRSSAAMGRQGERSGAFSVKLQKEIIA
jgi:hypothetical protein